MQDMYRRRGKKVPRRVFVIVCEGKETEPNYFKEMRQDFRLSRVNVRILPAEGAPITVVEKAIQEKTQLDDPRDEVWCVLDVEQLGNNPSFDRAIDIALRRKLHLAVSNPAFEYWYLIHYERSDKPFRNADDVISQLKRYLPDYDKSDSSYSILKDRTETAIANATYLRNNATSPWEKFPNSSTGVDILVTKILEIAKG